MMMRKASAPMTIDPLFFVHLTDLHVSAPQVENPLLLSDTMSAVRASFAAIRALPQAPDFVVVSGDLTDRGRPEDYETLKDLLTEEAGDWPLVLALGNHDLRAPFRAVFGLGQGDAAHDHDAVIAGLHVITLDTAIPGHVGGGIAPAQQDWLRDRLAAHPALRKLLVLHHAPLLDLARAQAWDRLDAASTEALRDAIRGHDVVGILSGHVHMEEVSLWHGVPVVIGQGHHAATDPTAPRGEIRLVEGAGLTLCRLRDSGLTATFVPHPQTRALLRRIDTAALMAREAARAG